MDEHESWPDWWRWEIELTPHVEKRMEERGFTEIDLRAMLQRARSHRPNHVEGRHVIETTDSDSRWEVIVEPDAEDRLLVVITAYAIESAR